MSLRFQGCLPTCVHHSLAIWPLSSKCDTQGKKIRRHANHETASVGGLTTAALADLGTSTPILRLGQDRQAEIASIPTKFK